MSLKTLQYFLILPFPIDPFEGKRARKSSGLNDKWRCGEGGEDKAEGGGGNVVFIDLETDKLVLSIAYTRSFVGSQTNETESKQLRLL